jgi:hypothetical protein
MEGCAKRTFVMVLDVRMVVECLSNGNSEKQDKENGPRDSKHGPAIHVLPSIIPKNITTVFPL